MRPERRPVAVSTAFAERERTRRGLNDKVGILTGGTHPADHVHDEVIKVIDEAGLNLSSRTPEATLVHIRMSSGMIRSVISKIYV